MIVAKRYNEAAMPFTDHFASQIPAYPAMPGNIVVLATLAEMERAVRDPACSEITVQVQALGYLQVSKASVREKLSMLRHVWPKRILAATVTTDADGNATIAFDDAALQAAAIHAPEITVGKPPA